jgi:hypothetical protein
MSPIYISGGEVDMYQGGKKTHEFAVAIGEGRGIERW